jgi:hypothetical protein
VKKLKGPLSRIRVVRENPREVEIVRADGAREMVSAARAARLVTQGEAQPGAWDREDLEAVADADARRQQRQVATLRLDGVLVNDGAPNHVNPVPLSALGQRLRR